MSSGMPPQVESPQVEPMSAPHAPAESSRLGSAAFSAVRFFGDVKQEFWRISWTTPQELKTSTKVVLGGMLLAGFVIYGVDLVLQGTLSLLNSLSFWIAG